MKYEKATGHNLSTMTNLNFRYFHHTDKNILQKIANKKSVMDDDFTREDKKGEICFGLFEKGKPATLISPRPKILAKKEENGKTILKNEISDDVMNIVLQKIDHELILKAMFDKNILIEINI